ncbi:10751_t:CDS:1, partial [Paraglomus brasilianum]
MWKDRDEFVVFAAVIQIEAMQDKKKKLISGRVHENNSQSYVRKLIGSILGMDMEKGT